MKAYGFVAVFGASDDLMELRGAIHDEFDCYDGDTAYFHNGKFLASTCDCEDCPHEKKLLQKAKQLNLYIEAIWDSEGYSWIYKTPIPHETFEVFEDDEKYCRGIVFHIDHISQE